MKHIGSLSWAMALSLLGIASLSACNAVANLRKGELNLDVGRDNGNSGNNNAQTQGNAGSSAKASKPRGNAPAELSDAEEANKRCQDWIDGNRKDTKELLAAQIHSLDEAKAAYDRWDKIDTTIAVHCETDCAVVKDANGESVPKCTFKNAKFQPLVDSMLDEVSKAEPQVLEKAIRGALKEDPKWARNKMFTLFRNEDRKPNEWLRGLAHDVSKAYDASLEQMFKANGGLGKKDNGEVVCVYSRNALPAGGKGHTGFATHFDGPGVIYVGCRLQGPANGQNGKILLYFNADTGPAERMLHEVDLGHSSAVGKTDWVTGKFSLPAGEDFAKTVHYTFDAQVIVRNVWNEQTILSSSVLTWHK